jgi:uncharacterized protein
VSRLGRSGSLVFRYATVLLLGFCGAGLLASCGAPTLTLYTLGAPSAASDATPLGRKPLVIAVARVTVSDELDTEDIVVRDGSTLLRSHLGRWASRLSLGITDRLTERLAKRRPDAVVTDRPLTETPAYRVLVNIGRLDVTTAGIATLDADWLVVPHDPSVPTQRNRGHFSATGPVATDHDVVTLVGRVLDQLAEAIDLPGARQNGRRVISR